MAKQPCQSTAQQLCHREHSPRSEAMRVDAAVSHATGSRIPAPQPCCSFNVRHSCGRWAFPHMRRKATAVSATSSALLGPAALALNFRIPHSQHRATLPGPATRNVLSPWLPDSQITACSHGSVLGSIRRILGQGCVLIHDGQLGGPDPADTSCCQTVRPPEAEAA